MRRRERLGHRWRVLILGLPVGLLLGTACAPKVDLTKVDAAGERLRDLVGAATQALGSSDAAALQRCRGDLVRLRLDTRELKLPRTTGELRDTLVAAMDLLVDGLDASAAGVAARSAGESSEDLAQGRERLVEATAHLEFCQSRLEGALATLNRFQEIRTCLEARH